MKTVETAKQCQEAFCVAREKRWQETIQKSKCDGLIGCASETISLHRDAKEQRGQNCGWIR